MQSVNVRQLQDALICASEQIVKSEPLLTELDSIIGDGDHGTGMRDGFSALGQTLKEHDYSDVFELMHEAGITLVKTMGGASGVVFGTIFIAGDDGIKGKAELNADELIEFFDVAALSISKRCKTLPGDKTMLDALLQANEAMRAQRHKTDDVAAILNAGYQGACQGAQSTKSMISRKGRSKNFREKSLGVEDPGAVSLSIIFRGISDCISGL